MSRRPKLRNLGFNQIGEEKRKWLVKATEEDEVREMVESCTSGKAPEPNRFTLTLFQHLHSRRIGDGDCC